MSLISRYRNYGYPSSYDYLNYGYGYPQQGPQINNGRCTYVHRCITFEMWLMMLPHVWSGF